MSVCRQIGGMTLGGVHVEDAADCRVEDHLMEFRVHVEVAKECRVEDDVMESLRCVGDISTFRVDDGEVFGTSLRVGDAGASCVDDSIGIFVICCMEDNSVDETVERTDSSGDEDQR